MLALGNVASTLFIDHKKWAMLCLHFVWKQTNLLQILFFLCWLWPWTYRQSPNRKTINFINMAENLFIGMLISRIVKQFEEQNELWNDTVYTNAFNCFLNSFLACHCTDLDLAVNHQSLRKVKLSIKLHLHPICFLKIWNSWIWWTKWASTLYLKP